LAVVTRGSTVSLAGDRPVAILGGASSVNHYLAAGSVDDLWLQVPFTPGAGERLFHGLPAVPAIVSSRATGLVSHLRFRVVR
jgi:hypothetical protein